MQTLLNSELLEILHVLEHWKLCVTRRVAVQRKTSHSVVYMGVRGKQAAVESSTGGGHQPVSETKHLSFCESDYHGTSYMGYI